MRMRNGTARALALVAALAVAGFAGSAQAVPQFTPTATSLLHTVGSGEPGAEWNTGGTTSGGVISYDSGTELLTITAQLDVLNYYDPLDGACSTDSGSNCSFNYPTDLDITLTASLASITVTPVVGSIVEVLVSFETAGGGSDLIVTDSLDGGSTQLSGDIVAGTFGGSPTTGLQASILFDTGAGTALFNDVNSVGFFQVDPGTPYASLFGTTFIGVNLGTFSDFSPTLDALIAVAAVGGGLGSFTAEANAQIFRTTSGEFVPEPATALLIGMGLLGLLRRRN